MKPSYEIRIQMVKKLCFNILLGLEYEPTRLKGQRSFIFTYL